MIAELNAALSLALATAVEAGTLLVQLQGRARVDFKGVYDLVTEADRASEALCQERLTTGLPGSDYLGEEGAARQTDAEWQWVVDPLDATNNYANGIPIFCVSIALRRWGETVVGVVHAPRMGETFHAVRGAGAFMNDRPIRVGTKSELSQSIVATGFPYDKKTNPHNNIDHFAAIVPHVRGVRRMGSAAIDLCWLAAGRFDAFWELRLGAWDAAAGVLMIEEAGGRVTGFGGGPVPDPPTHLLASNGALHEEMMALLALHPHWR